MKIVLLDVDGVLADFVTSYLDLVYRVTGRRHSHQHVTQFDLGAALALSRDEAATVNRFVTMERFAQGLQPLAGAIDGVSKLQSIANVYIVTSPWNSNETWCHDRERWLREHFEIPHSRVLHCSAKYLVRGDVFVDDRADTVTTWQAEHPSGTAILWAQPWNAREEWQGIRTNDWDRVLEVCQ